MRPLIPGLALCVVALSTVVAQDRSQVFRTEAVGVVVDAVVVDEHGTPLRCLSKSDFRVAEDGKDQQIEGFEFVGSKACDAAAATSTPPASSAVDVTRPPAVTALVFEELGPDARAAALRAAQAFVRERRLDTEFVGVFALDFAIHTIVPYTRDEGALMEGLRVAAMRPGCPVAVNGLTANADSGSWCEAVSELNTLSGLKQVTRTLAALPGRKNVLLFSQGFRVSTADSAVDRLEDLIATANQRGVTFQNIDAVGLRAIDGRQDVRQRLSKYTGGEEGPGGLATSNKEDANTLLALDPTTALVRLARGTGGQFVSDRNDLERAVRELGAGMHDYYRLSYRPTDQSSNRAYHRIGVKVSVPGAVVQTRSGYYSDRERNRDVHLLGSVEVAPHLILDSGTSPRDFETTVSVNPTANAVDVLVNVLARGLTFQTVSGRYEARVTVLARAIGQDKNVLAASSDSFALRGPAEGLSAAQAHVIRFSKTLTRNNATAVEVIAYDPIGRRSSVERFELTAGR